MKYKKASFWKRSVACLIDTALLSVVFGLVQIAFRPSPAVTYAIETFFFFSYNIFMDAYQQGSLGKGLLRLEVIRRDGTPPSLVNSFYRNFGKYISALPLGYGYFRILAPHRAQTIHDELGNCMVVQHNQK